MCAATLGVHLAAQSEVPDDELTREVLKFTQAYSALETHYVEAFDPEPVIYNGGIRGGLSALDPFSSFFDADQFEQLRQFTTGTARGFGSVLYVQPGKVLVLQTAEGSPSRRAGLGPGDEIVSLNGTRLDRLDLQSLVELLQKARTQTVRLGVIRPGKVVAEDFELHPADVVSPSVDKAFLLEPGVGYVHLNSFDMKTPEEVGEAVKRLVGSSLEGLILDLRDNRGGVLDSATALASAFLKPGLLLLTQRGRAVPERSIKTIQAPVRFDMPLIVMVNGTTASAAEVFVAALQEHDRAIVVGQPTFGKGVVESVAELSENTGLALTTAQYFTPSGRSIQRPLPGTALAEPASSLRTGVSPSFRTANGRPLAAGGGIHPDVTLESVVRDPWVTFVDQRGAFTTFASQYLTLYGKIGKEFEPDEKTLRAFKDYLTRLRVLTPEEYWDSNEDYMKLRIKTELVSLVFGLAAANEVATRSDPEVQQTLKLFPKINALLQPRTPDLATTPPKK